MRLHRCYFEHLYNAQTFVSNKQQIPVWATVSKTYRQLFIELATVIMSIGAKPFDYIHAQFEEFARLSKLMGKRRPILPQPNQLLSTGAHVRYVTYRSSLEGDAQARRLRKNSVQTYAKDERTLRRYMREFKLTEGDVLTMYTNKFSRAFLRNKGIWDVLKSQYGENA